MKQWFMSLWAKLFPSHVETPLPDGQLYLQQLRQMQDSDRAVQTVTGRNDFASTQVIVQPSVADLDAIAHEELIRQSTLTEQNVKKVMKQVKVSAPEPVAAKVVRKRAAKPKAKKKAKR